MAVMTFAAIDIGSYEVSMKIFEMSKRIGFRELNDVRYSLELGKGVYSGEKIDSEMLNVLCEVLNDFKRLMHAEEMGLPHEQCYELAIAGMLHDIGKLKLTSYINGQEQDPLVIEELKYVRMHSTLGYEELKGQGYSDFVLESILYHHENYDGSGYPANKAGEDIPIGARILRVCDVYAALISDRPYRKAFDISAVMELMIDEVKNFDMQVFLAFQRVVHNGDGQSFRK